MRAGARSGQMALAREPINSVDRFLYHKTTHRAACERVRQAFPECGDAVLWNERGEITETCITNLVLEDVAGRLWTPPVSCGLLPGTFRAELLDTGVIREKMLSRADLCCAKAVWMINSVRKWRRARMAGG
jgi:para-aminobenzoate synthetase / 4-amino-4-deoxychorismate lyase